MKSQMADLGVNRCLDAYHDARGKVCLDEYNISHDRRVISSLAYLNQVVSCNGTEILPLDSNILSRCYGSRDRYSDDLK